MLSPFNLLLITAIFCIVMLFVLCSLIRSGIAGVREWTLANVLAFVALLLYASRGVGPAFLSIEVANGLLAAAITMVFVGFQRFFALRIPTKTLIAGFAVTLSGVAAFHYAMDSIAVRTVVVSLFHSAVCFAIGRTIIRPEKASRSRYPYLFTKYAVILLGFGHAARGIVYATKIDVLASSFQATPLNLFFLSVGALVLPVLTMGATMMVHDRMMANAEHAANRDFLTGAWSRRAFFELADRELMRAQRTGRAFSLLVFDVDHFKRINDTYGHAAGDQVLVDIALRVENVIRSVDYFARIGGEEFAVLLPETERTAALLVAERLRLGLDRPASDIGSDGRPRTAAYTVSVGVAELRGTEPFRDLLQRADTALYKAKTSGRNLVAAAQTC